MKFNWLKIDWSTFAHTKKWSFLNELNRLMINLYREKIEEQIRKDWNIFERRT